MRFFYFRSLKFNPKIVTSYRSHGKWGDLIICALPVSWCINILSNSTTLLKLVEWQMESNFMTLRVRAKQWYWVYKYDTKSLVDNYVNNKLTLQIGNNQFFKKNYFFNKSNIYLISNNLIKNNFIKTFKLKLADNFFENNSMVFDNTKYNFLSTTTNNLISKVDKTVDNSFTSHSKLNTYYNDLSINRYNRDIFLNLKSIDLIKSIDNSYFNNNSLLKVRFSTNNYKSFNNNYYYVLKQKTISDWSKDSNYTFFNESLFTHKNFINNFSSILYNNNTTKIQYYNNMRLLRVNSLLFLPTNLQICIITNSFDVIHSWFIPGLGLKMDCVPGRSTHHTLYINTPGLYYGQCAEICGRFHHHMPIKICALKFEHYTLIFNHFILPNIFDLSSNNTFKTLY